MKHLENILSHTEISTMPYGVLIVTLLLSLAVLIISVLVVTSYVTSQD